MPTSVDALAFLLGCALVAIAILGGGIDIKEIKVPTLSAPARWMSAAFGFTLMTVALFSPQPLNDLARSSDPAPVRALPSDQPRSRTVTIYDYLTDPQVFERVEIFLSGYRAGEISIDTTKRSDSLIVSRQGNVHSYALRGISGTRDGAAVRTRNVSGDGRIDLDHAEEYFIDVLQETATDVIGVLRPERERR